MQDVDDHPCSFRHNEFVNPFVMIPCNPLRRRRRSGMLASPSFLPDVPPRILTHQDAIQWTALFHVEGDLDIHRCYSKGGSEYWPPAQLCASTVGRIAAALHRVDVHGPLSQTLHVSECVPPHGMVNLYFEYKERPVDDNASACTTFRERRLQGLKTFKDFLTEYAQETLVGSNDGRLQVLVYSTIAGPHCTSPGMEFHSRVVMKHPSFMFQNQASMKLYAEEVVEAFQVANPTALNLGEGLVMEAYEPWGCPSTLFKYVTCCLQ